VARPGLRQHPKFKRLVHLLRQPIPHVLGYLECLWSVAYEHGKAEIGSELDVELSADWPGETGALCKALVDCRFLDDVGDARYAVHDLFDHAPEYVQARARKEAERQKVKHCDYCGSEFRSSEVHARFCSATCRQADYRARHTKHPVTERDEARRHANNGTLRTLRGVTESDGPPAPSPAQPSPHPAPLEEKRTAPPRKPFRPPTPEEVNAYADELGKRIDGGRFVDYYASNGWKVGKNPMRDWRAAVRNWISRDRQDAPRDGPKQSSLLMGMEDFVQGGET
jgi:hypothetical protein